jgi:hypothetical protein
MEFQPSYKADVIAGKRMGSKKDSGAGLRRSKAQTRVCEIK